MPQSETTEFRRDLADAIPNLRAFARTLTNNPAQADDLVQETLLKALSHADRFQMGTNLIAWLFTILRNCFYSELRKRRREVEDSDNVHATQTPIVPNQVESIYLDEFRTALGQLPDEHREALILVGASGFSYEEAAEICGVPIGTIKSRVNRARRRLSELLDTNYKAVGE